MFFGETAINLDAKGRLAIPMRYRDAIQEACEGRLVLTYSAFDSGALYMYPEQHWERVRDEVTGLSTFNPGHRSLQRKLVGSASAVEPDANGRIQLPQTLRQVVVTTWFLVRPVVPFRNLLRRNQNLSLNPPVQDITVP